MSSSLATLRKGRRKMTIDVVSSSLRVPPTPFASTIDDDGTPDRMQDDSSGGGSEDEADTP
jgi:hypothetical protein